MKDSDSHYAFYGSLRRGMENHKPYEEHLTYLFSARIKGFKLYSMGAFPCAVIASEKDSIVVEVFQIKDNSTRQAIHVLEMLEGYYFTEIHIDGHVTAIYLYQTPGNYQEVKSGDWVSFYRQSTH